MCNDKTIHRLICLITQKEITKTEVNHVAGNGKKKSDCQIGPQKNRTVKAEASKEKSVDGGSGGWGAFLASVEPS